MDLRRLSGEAFARRGAVGPNCAGLTGDTRSTIAGQINANGQVFLVNPNGILITPTGTVSAAGFVASTLDLDEKQFMDGKITATGRGGSIANYGTISIVKGGFAALIGGRVENAGLIVAPLGKVGLGAGTRATLDLEGDGFLQVALPASGGGIVMPGRIVADGGAVVLSAAQARDVARSTVNLSGVIETKGVKRRGGTVVLTGDAIQLTGAAIDVSGAAGGGSVTIGGGAQGKGDIAHALTLNVDAASSITADATDAGDGGDIILWSDQRTDFAGAISATGAGVGTGGDAEVSSAGLLGFTGTANLTGSRFGTLLLDPYNITISNGADTGGFTANADDSVINATTLVGALATANVTVATGAGGAQGGNISVATPLAWTSKGTLTLDAAGAISLGASIDAAAGGLTLNAGGAISAAGGMSVARFTLASGNWTQNNVTLPAFAAGDFRITGGIFLRATGGAGSSVSPWALTDIYGVQGIATMFSGHFTLANDIDAAGTAGWNDGAGFAPIGNFNSNGGFTGSLSGAGHVVSGLTIHRPSQDYVALIGYLAGGGRVSGIGMAGGAISGSNYVGGLAGFSFGTVSNAHATGAVSGDAYVGGLVGYSNNMLSDAYATGAVSGDESVGGLVGTNSGTVSDAYWDIGTTGHTTSAGGTGLTTAQLQSGGASGLGAAFSGGVSGLYPYLTSFFPDGVQAISGFAYGADGTGAAIAQVGIHVNGSLLGATTISTGTNGYYYMMVPVGTFPAASNMLGQTITLAGASSVSGLTYSDGLALDGNGNLSGLSVTSGLRTATTALQSWSALTAAFPAPFDAVSYAAFTPALASTSWDVTATNVGGFTVDVPLALGRADLTLASARNLTLASGVSIAASSITLSAQGRFVNNAGANALSAGDRWLVYLPRTVGNVFGELDSGNTARWGIAAGTAVSTAGNRYVFAEEAILTFTPAVTTKAYGETLTFGLTEGQHFTVTGYRQGVAGVYLGDTGASAWTGTPIFSSNGAAGGANVKPGGYGITLAGVTGLGDYRVDTLTGTLTVTPATLTYAADAATRTYGAANPVLGGSVAGFVNGEDLAGATTGTLAFASMAGASANVGSYAANGSGLAANHGNYVFVQAARNATALSVTPAQLTVTGNKVYDRTPGYVTGQLMVTGGVNGEAVSLTSGSGTVGSFDAGSHTGSLSGLAIAVAGGNGLASNYQLPTTGTLAITPRALVVTADAISRIYGDANPTMGGATGDDLVVGDTITSVTLASPATGASNVGRYDLTGSGATGNGLGNYTITYATRVGGFAVTPRPITVTADGLTRLYGDAEPALTYTIGGRGLVNGDLLSGALVTDATDTRGVGIYGITQGTLAASANYTINPFVAGTFTILPKAPPPGTIAGTLLPYQFAGRTRPLPGSAKLRILQESEKNGGWGAGQTFATCPGDQQEVLCTAN